MDHQRNISLSGLVSPGSWVTAYANTYVKVPDENNYLVRITTQDAIKVWGERHPGARRAEGAGQHHRSVRRPGDPAGGLEPDPRQELPRHRRLGRGRRPHPRGRQPGQRPRHLRRAAEGPAGSGAGPRVRHRLGSGAPPPGGEGAHAPALHRHHPGGQLRPVHPRPEPGGHVPLRGPERAVLAHHVRHHELVRGPDRRHHRRPRAPHREERRRGAQAPALPGVLLRGSEPVRPRA